MILNGGGKLNLLDIFTKLWFFQHFERYSKMLLNMYKRETCYFIIIIIIYLSMSFDQYCDNRPSQVFYHFAFAVAKWNQTCLLVDIMFDRSSTFHVNDFHSFCKWLLGTVVHCILLMSKSFLLRNHICDVFVVW